MGIKIALKKRFNGNNFIVPVSQILGIMELNEELAKQNLYDSFKVMAQDGAGYVHDRTQFATIVNWMPEGGLPLTKLADWIPLARKINNLSDKDVEINLSTFQANMIWERLSSDTFIVQRADPAFMSFIGDFIEVLGKQFPGASVDDGS